MTLRQRDLPEPHDDHHAPEGGAPAEPTRRPDLQLMSKEQHWQASPKPAGPARRAPHGTSASTPEWTDEALRRRVERPQEPGAHLVPGGGASGRARDLADADSRSNQARLGAARQARAAAEVAAVERAAAMAQGEAARLVDAESELSAATAATRLARAEFERLQRLEAECRARADAQRTLTVQARMIHRTLVQRHGTGAAGQTGGSASTSSAGSAPPSPSPSTSDDAAPDASGFAPTVPAPVPILSIVPSDPGLQEDASQRPRMGTVLVEGQRLTPVDVEVVLMHQAGKPRRFGEIAVSLGLLEISDVVWALRRQRPHPQGDAGGVVTPIAGPLVLRDRPDSPAAAVIRDIARQIVERRAGETPRRALSVVSVGIGEGKSTVAANLAMAMAEQGERVLLVDTDFTRSRLQQMLPGLSRSQGLGALLAGREALADAIARPVGWSTQPRDLHVLPAGESRGDPVQLARLPAFVDLLQSLLGQYDQVLLDTAATSQGPGGLQLACMTGSALVVARPGHTRSADLDRLTRSLRQGGAAVLGVVMNSH